MTSLIHRVMHFTGCPAHLLFCLLPNTGSDSDDDVPLLARKR